MNMSLLVLVNMLWYFLLLYLSNFTYVHHHHHHHIFHISPGSSLPSILSIPLPSLYMLPLDGCPSYSKDVDYGIQIYQLRLLPEGRLGLLLLT